MIKAKTLYENANGNYYQFAGYDEDIIEAYNEILIEIKDLEKIKKTPKNDWMECQAVLNAMKGSESNHESQSERNI